MVVHMRDETAGLHPHAAHFLAWLRALERGVTGSELAAFFTPDVLAYELPNLVSPRGARRDLSELLAAAERGQQVVRDQRFEVHALIRDGDQLAARLTWSAQLACAVGGRAEGERLSASIASFVTFRDGRIAENHSYDCYAPSTL